MPTASFTTRIEVELKQQLERIAKYEARSASYVANQAIKAFVEERIATRALIDSGLALVERGAEGIEPDAVHSWLLDDGEGEFPKPQS